MEASAAAYDALYAPVCGDALAALYEGGARVTLEPPREGRCGHPKSAVWNRLGSHGSRAAESVYSHRNDYSVSLTSWDARSRA